AAARPRRLRRKNRCKSYGSASTSLLAYTVPMRRILLLLSALSLAACGLVPFPFRPTAGPRPGTTATPGGLPRATPTSGTPPDNASPGPAVTLTPPGTPREPVALRVWLPPEFTPDVRTRGGQVLADQ